MNKLYEFKEVERTCESPEKAVFSVDGELIQVFEHDDGALSHDYMSSSVPFHGLKVLCTTTIESQPEFQKLKRERDALKSELKHILCALEDVIRTSEIEECMGHVDDLLNHVRSFENCADILGVGEVEGE